MQYTYDYSKLRKRITETCGTYTAFAAAMGTYRPQIWRKLQNTLQWRQHEIAKAIDLLHLKTKDIAEYFFTLKVQ